MTETQPGRFEAATVLATEGVYLVRVMASGLAFSGVSFTREQTLTAAVFVGGDQPLPTTPPKQPSPLCCIIESLTETESVIRFLDQHGLNAAEIRKAIGRCCADPAVLGELARELVIAVQSPSWHSTRTVCMGRWLAIGEWPGYGRSRG